ncbi:MAG: L,D-transpeptidase family protein [Gemmatimonadota bacterium]|nr:L,D-transpeptidase family protein [Gemmatimonadota bacterium]
MPLTADMPRFQRHPSTALTAVLAILAAGCGGPKIPEAALRDAIGRRSAEVSRDREWVVRSLETVYAGGDHLWLDGEKLGEDGAAALSALKGADHEGLDAEAFGVTAALAALGALQALPESDSAGRTDALVDLEVRLSLGVLEYARDLVRGRFDPAQAGQDWRIEPEPLPSNPLVRVRDGEPVGDVLASLRPRAPVYARLVETLATLREVQAGGGWPGVDADVRARIGWPGHGVASLRARLRASEDSVERLLAASGGDSNVYDADLAGAVRRFQSRHGLEPDGELGYATLRELATPVEERIEDVILNLDRLRWLPRDLGEHAIVVNVAGFEFELLEDHETKLAMNVIVGRASWATTVFTARMERLEFNPFWNVPASIAAAEVLPAARNDPGYLARNGFEVVGPDGSADGVTGDPDADGFRIRQRPGARNALGQVKFMFPNPYSIYLHDTPDDYLFSRSVRAFSHGCIRLERPIELAREIVEHHTDLPLADVDRILASGRNVSVELDRPLDVYVVYLTAWVGEDGTSYFYRDIYDRDDALRRMVTTA